MPPEAGQEAVLGAHTQAQGLSLRFSASARQVRVPIYPLYSANKLGHSGIESLVELLKCFLAEAK